MSNYFEGQSQAKTHEGDIELDDNIIAHLPSDCRVISCKGHGASNWNQTAKIHIECSDENGAQYQRSYFLKILTGSKARGMVHGEYESMRLIHDAVPGYASRPLACGECKTSKRYYILFSFHELLKGLPDIPKFAQAVSQLHSSTSGASPNGKFGFHITTYNGTLPQDNSWTDTWEEFYTRGMKRMLELEEEAGGPSEEMKAVAGPFLDIVIPRLLRPLETGNRHVDPVLIHGDLWIGNVSPQAGSRDPLMFDSSAFWGHHEYELSTMRPLDNDWGRECLEEYHASMPKSEPVEDWDARNALYATRTYIHDSALYPDLPKFRQKLVTEMRKLVEQFPFVDE